VRVCGGVIPVRTCLVSQVRVTRPPPPHTHTHPAHTQGAAATAVAQQLPHEVLTGAQAQQRFPGQCRTPVWWLCSAGPGWELESLSPALAGSHNLPATWSPGLRLPADMPVLFEQQGGILEPEKVIAAHVKVAQYHGAQVGCSASMGGCPPVPV
jgi:hypothetical protein